MRTAARTDANHAEIVKALRRVGPGARLGFDLTALTSICRTCAGLYRPMYAHATRKYCSLKCSQLDATKADARVAVLKRAARVAAMKRTALARVQLCAACGVRLKVADPRTATCGGLECRAEMRRRKGGDNKMPRRYGARKDQNHNEIVRALEAGGCATIDTSDKGDGFPDLIVCRRGMTHLVEVKNAANYYGKKGANKNQVAWAVKWPSPVWILRTMKDVEAFVNGRFGELQAINAVRFVTA